MQTQAVIALGKIAAKINTQRELGGTNGSETFLDQVVEILRHHADHGVRLDILDGGDAGDRFMPTCFRKQRHVVAKTLVAVRATEVKDLPAAHRTILWIGEVRTR
jgi:hypothetical protein